MAGVRIPGLFVIETTRNQYLGAIQVNDDRTLVVYTGFRGQPAKVSLDDVVGVFSAEGHPDVVAL